MSRAIGDLLLRSGNLSHAGATLGNALTDSAFAGNFRLLGGHMTTAA